MKITVAGYQAVVDPTTVEIVGFTVITGESNLGKSSFIRGAEASIINQRGNDFISLGKEVADVRWERNGQSLEWLKTHKSASYKINGQEHNKAGTSTPETEITKFGFFGVKAGDTIYRPQIQSQFDKPFIVGENSPTISAALLSASKESQVLGKAIKIGQKAQNEKAGELVIREGTVKILDQKLTNTEKNKQSLQERQQKANEAEAALNQVKAKKENFTSLQLQYNKAKAHRDAAALCPVDPPPVPPSKAKESTLRDLHHRWRRHTTRKILTEQITKKSVPQPPDQTLAPKLLNLIKLRREWSQAEKRNQKTKEVATQKVPTAPEIHDTWERRERLQDLKEEYQLCYGQRDEAQKELAHLEDQTKETEREIEEVLQTLQYCPVCKQTQKRQ